MAETANLVRGGLNSPTVSRQPHDPPFLVCLKGFNPRAAAPLR